MKTTSTDIRGLQLTLAVYLVIFVLKLIVYVVSGVMALYERIRAAPHAEHHEHG